MTATGKVRRLLLERRNGYAARSYALISYGFTEQNAEAATLGMNVLRVLRVPRWARGTRVNP